MIKKILKILGWIAIIGNTALVLLLGYWRFYPFQVTEVVQPIEILNENNEIAIGEPIEMLLLVTKNNDYKPSVNLYITCDDGNLVTLAPLGRNLPKGEYEARVDSYLLPPKVLVGSVCKMNFVNTYEVNPVRNISRTWVSEPFKVIRR